MAVRPPSGAFARYDGVAPATIVLVRHGVTALTEVGALSGGDVPGPPLTGAGRRQAAQVADAVFRIGKDRWMDLPRPDAIVASPMVRAQETAAAIARRLGQPVAVDERFAECRFGAWEGLVPEQVHDRWPGALARWVSEGDYAPPQGESYADLGRRVAPALADLVTATGASTSVVVAHAAAIRAMVGQSLDAPAASWGRVRIPPCSISVLRVWPDGQREVTTSGYPAASS